MRRPPAAARRAAPPSLPPRPARPAVAPRRPTPGRRSLAAAADPDDLAALRAALDAAVDAEDYGRAAKLRDQLNALESDAALAAAEANDRFYAAFRAADMDVMAAVVGEGDHVQVIHPGCGCVAGRDAVLESWRLIFASAPGGLAIDLADVRVHAPAAGGEGALAVVTCVERVDAGDSVGRVLATNVFERQGGGRYRLILHHGSPAPPRRG